MTRPLLAAVALLATCAADARADGVAPGTVLRQEVIGGEVAPISFNQGSPPLDDSPSRVQPGLGLRLRLFRHRWLQGAYWTPVQAGFFFGWGADPDRTFFVAAATEGGATLRIGGEVLEVGLGVGASLLAIRYSKMCNGDCVIGGVGWTVSPVVRYLFQEARSRTLGLVLRAEIPLSVPPANFDLLGYWSARGMLFLVAFDAGFGWG